MIIINNSYPINVVRNESPLPQDNQYYLLGIQSIKSFLIYLGTEMNVHTHTHTHNM